MSTASSFAPLAAATGKALSLSMQRLWLTGQVVPAGARIVVQHVFQSEEEKPLEVIYAFPLPRDGALRRFRIKGDDFETHSELKETDAAVKVYEKGISRGSLSALVRQYGDGLVNLTVGNIRPKERVTVDLEILCGVELRDAGFRFRFPFTLAPNYHSRAKAALTEHGEGEMELPGDEFGDLILPRFREDPSALHQVGFELTTVSQLALDEIGSPSHAIRVKQDGGRSARITLAAEHDVPNRDLVLDVSFQSIEPQVLASRNKDGKSCFAAIVPSSCFGVSAQEPRRVVILLDKSGSMQGAPILQARKAIEACLGALSEADMFGVVAFNNNVQTFQSALVHGTRELRDQAHQFLTQVEAAGGTELAKGFFEAAKLLQGPGDIFVLTDGQVSGTEKILADARAAGVRLHCLGIGSASQDRFLALLSRETGGVSRFVTPKERVDLTAVDLFNSVGRPVASGLKAGGNVRPEPASTVFGGTPVLLFGETDEVAGRQIELTWTGGRLNLPISFSDSDIAETVWLLQGSRLITDWESRYPSSEALAPVEKRSQSRVASRLIELSQTYGLASREMSLVAVVTRAGDRASELPETRVVSVGMAQDTIFDAFFGSRLMRATSAGSIGTSMNDVLITSNASMETGLSLDALRFDANNEKPQEGLFARFMRRRPADLSSQSADDILLDLASHMDSDGGMPGSDNESRAIASVVALLAFLSQGHTAEEGIFRSHVARLVLFLKSVQGLSNRHQRTVDAVLELVRTGKAPPGEWIALARTSGNHWKKVEQVC